MRNGRSGYTRRSDTRFNARVETPMSSPEIRPVIIEGPPIEARWDELWHLHFSDRLLYFMSPATDYAPSAHEAEWVEAAFAQGSAAPAVPHGLCGIRGLADLLSEAKTGAARSRDCGGAASARRGGSVGAKARDPEPCRAAGRRPLRGRRGRSRCDRPALGLWTAWARLSQCPSLLAEGRGPRRRSLVILGCDPGAKERDLSHSMSFAGSDIGCRGGAGAKGWAG